MQELIDRALDGGGFVGEEADSLDAGHAASALAFVDRLDAADDLLASLFASAQTRGSVLTYVVALVWRGWVALRRGLVSAAESDERAAAELAARHGLDFVLPWAQAFRACALVELDQIEAAGRLVDELAVTTADSQALASMALDARARVRIAQGRREDAIADLRAVGRHQESIGVRNPNILHARSNLGLALGRASAEAQRLVDAELERAREVDCARAIGIALRARGLLELPGDGIATLREATEILADSPARLEYARTLAHLGGHSGAPPGGSTPARRCARRLTLPISSARRAWRRRPRPSLRPPAADRAVAGSTALPRSPRPSGGSPRWPPAAKQTERSPKRYSSAARPLKCISGTPIASSTSARASTSGTHYAAASRRPDSARRHPLSGPVNHRRPAALEPRSSPGIWCGGQTAADRRTGLNRSSLGSDGDGRGAAGGRGAGVVGRDDGEHVRAGWNVPPDVCVRGGRVLAEDRRAVAELDLGDASVSVARRSR